jgi:membrane protein YqaA with SNARE-associated domain
MVGKWVKSLIHRSQKKLSENIDSPWYFFGIMFLAAADMFISVLPTDVFLFTTIYLKPKKWLLASVTIAMGSLIGASLICWGLEYQREWVMNSVFPEVFTHPKWAQAERFVTKWGLGAVFLTGLGPLPQQFTLILAVLGGISSAPILFWYAVGRLIKFIAYGWIASHAPDFLRFINTEWVNFLSSQNIKSVKKQKRSS